MESERATTLNGGSADAPSVRHPAQVASNPTSTSNTVHLDDYGNDSEAETEILPGSQSHTPVKADSKRIFVKNDETMMEQENGRLVSQDMKQANGIGRGRHSRHNSHAGGKRKAQDDVGPTNGHNRSTRSTGASPGSPVKKARLLDDRSPSPEQPRPRDEDVKKVKGVSSRNSQNGGARRAEIVAGGASPKEGHESRDLTFTSSEVGKRPASPSLGGKRKSLSPSRFPANKSSRSSKSLPSPSSIHHEAITQRRLHPDSITHRTVQSDLIDESPPALPNVSQAPPTGHSKKSTNHSRQHSNSQRSNSATSINESLPVPGAAPLVPPSKTSKKHAPHRRRESITQRQSSLTSINEAPPSPNSPRLIPTSKISQKSITHRRPSSNSPSRITDDNSPDSSISRVGARDLRARSTSPYSKHKRSSSFQLALVDEIDPNRRLRARHQTQPPTLPTSSSRHTSEQRNTSLDSPSLNMAPRNKTIDKDGATLLARACEKGDLTTVQQILDESTGDIDTPDYSQNGPLQKACLNGHVEIVRLLIAAGANLEVANDPEVSGGDTPLIDAIDSGHVEVVRLLLDAGASPWHKNARYHMPTDCLNNAEDLDDDTRKEIRRLLRESKTRHLAMADDPCQSMEGLAEDKPPWNPKANATADKSKLNTEFTIAEMEQRAAAGDYAGFHYVMNAVQKTNMTCAMNAAYVGDVKIYKEVFQKVSIRDGNRDIPAGLEIDPVSRNNRDDTPILKAIGRGNLLMIKHILAQPGFDANRHHGGASYAEIARRHQGPRMADEIKMLEAAARQSLRLLQEAARNNSPERMDREQTDLSHLLNLNNANISGGAEASGSSRNPTTRTRRGSPGPAHAAASGTASSSAANERLEPEHEPKRRRLVRRSEMSDEELRRRDAHDDESDGMEEDTLPAAPLQPIVTAAVARETYLSTLPPALAAAFQPEGFLAGNSAQVPAIDKAWRKTLQHFMPLPVFKRIDIDATCPAGTGQDLYTLNIHVALFCHLGTLLGASSQLGLPTLPATRTHRASVINQSTLVEDLACANLWQWAPEAELERAGVPYSTLPGGALAIRREVLLRESRAKLEGLADTEFFFVEVAAFVEYTAGLEWLVDVDIHTSASIKLGGARADAPIFCNGRMIVGHNDWYE